MKNDVTDAILDGAITATIQQALETVSPHERMLKYFQFAHLPPHLSRVSQGFAELAVRVVADLKAGPERTVALRKLLEAKDCAVRQALDDATSPPSENR